jgi:hypothetical protein
LADEEEAPVRVLVIGTCHEYQREQDALAERVALRAEFDQLLRRLVRERNVSIILEEAGDNEQVWRNLKRDEQATLTELRALFAGTEAIGGPEDTIAKRIADESGERLSYFDIRPANADDLTIAECDEAMSKMTLEILGAATSVLLICGLKHAPGLQRRLGENGLHVDPIRFPRLPAAPAASRL